MKKFRGLKYISNLRIGVVTTIILTIVLVVLTISYYEVNLSKLSSDKAFLQLEIDTTRTTLSISEAQISRYMARNDQLKEELVKLEDQIHAMSNEVYNVKVEYDKVIEELEYYKYRELWYRDINFDEKYQEYTYDWCQQLGLDYDIALAKFKLESQFKVDARGYNKDEDEKVVSIDYGVGQVNSGNLAWAEELCGRDIDVVNNVYDNIEASLRIYKHYQDYWNNKGYTGYELNVRALNSYNRGIAGYLRYIEDGHSWDEWRYAKLVYKNLEQIR